MIQDIPPAAWGAIVTALGLIFAAVAKWGPDRSGAASKLTLASVSLINELQEQNVLLRGEVNELKAENRKLCDEVGDLKTQIDRLRRSIDRLTED